MSFLDHIESSSSSSSYRSFGRPVSSQEAVTRNISQINSNVSAIKKIASQLGTNKDNVQVRQQLNTLIDSTKNTAKETTQLIRDVEQGGSEYDRGRIMQQKLSKDFQSSLRAFQDVSKYAAEQEKRFAIPRPPSVGPHSSSSSVPLEDFNEPNFQEIDSSLQQQTNEYEFNSLLIAEREKGIKEIEKTVQDVNEIFIDLSNLVSEQGVMIDNIESNIESSASATTRATEELRKASGYQRSARTKLCFLTLIVLVILFIVIIVVYFFLK